MNVNVNVNDWGSGVLVRGYDVGSGGVEASVTVEADDGGGSRGMMRFRRKLKSCHRRRGRRRRRWTCRHHRLL